MYTVCVEKNVNTIFLLFLVICFQLLITQPFLVSLEG